MLKINHFCSVSFPQFPSLLGNRVISLLPMQDYCRSLKRHIVKGEEYTFCKCNLVNSLLLIMLVVLLGCLSSAQLLDHWAHQKYYILDVQSEELNQARGQGRKCPFASRNGFPIHTELYVGDSQGGFFLTVDKASATKEEYKSSKKQ